jgi:hypothetical protein
LIKCFATAFSTAILLYVSPILFNADFSFLIIPGTITVFTATWLYMDSAPPKKPAVAASDTSLDEKLVKPRASGWRVISAFFPSGALAYVGLLVTAGIAIAGIASLHM